MTGRGRINVAATVPETGASGVAANVIVIWDAGTSVDDLEEAIKAAARKAVLRVRESHRPSVDEGQLTLPFSES